MASPAFAADPDGAAVAANYTGTGIAVETGGGPVDIGVPAGYRQLKEAQLATLLTTGKLPTPARKTGVAASGSTSAVVAATSCGSYPCFSYAGFTGFHQKRNYYCLVAVVQSVAYRDLDDWYQLMGTSSLLAAQDKIYNGYSGSPAIKASPGPGATDTKALPWINRQFSQYSYGFYYVDVTPASLSSFMNYVHFDIADEFELVYVRVDLTISGGYAWNQGPNPDGTHPLHATMAAGYDDTAGIVVSYDPFAHANSNGTCNKSWDGGAATWGCDWANLPQSHYFHGMDSAGSGKTGPMWW